MTGQFYTLSGGKWTAPGRPPIGRPHPAKVRVRGLAASGAVVPPAVGVTPLPDALEIDYSSLNPQPGESLDTVLNRMTSLARVVLPAGTFNVVGASRSGYGVYAPKCLGLRGAGQDKTVILWAENSITNYVAPHAWAGSFMRLGPNDASVALANRVPVTLSELTLQGSRQLYSDGTTAMNTMGYFNYYGKGSVIRNVTLKGLNYGDNNYPPGETFGLNMFHDTDTIVDTVEVDGRDIAGNRIAASPIGGNNSTNLTIIGSNLHDAGWSGLTFSYTGSVSVGNATNGVSTTDVVIANNANHYVGQSGARFPCINHEQVLGPIRHTRPVMSFDRADLWDSHHLFFLNDLQDNPDIEIYDPVWTTSAPKNSGMLTLKLQGLQTTVPKVFLGGVQMTPIMQSGQPATALVGNPKTQFVCYY